MNKYTQGLIIFYGIIILCGILYVSWLIYRGLDGNPALLPLLVMTILPVSERLIEGSRNCDLTISYLEHRFNVNITNYEYELLDYEDKIDFGIEHVDEFQHIHQTTVQFKSRSKSPYLNLELYKYFPNNKKLYDGRDKITQAHYICFLNMENPTILCFFSHSYIMQIIQNVEKEIKDKLKIEAKEFYSLIELNNTRKIQKKPILKPSFLNNSIVMVQKDLGKNNKVTYKLILFANIEYLSYEAIELNNGENILIPRTWHKYENKELFPL